MILMFLGPSTRPRLFILLFPPSIRCLTYLSMTSQFPTKIFHTLR